MPRTLLIYSLVFDIIPIARSSDCFSMAFVDVRKISTVTTVMMRNTVNMIQRVRR